MYIVWDNLDIHLGDAWTRLDERHGGRFQGQRDFVFRAADPWSLVSSRSWRGGLHEEDADDAAPARLRRPHGMAGEGEAGAPTCDVAGGFAMVPIWLALKWNLFTTPFESNSTYRIFST